MEIRRAALLLTLSGATFLAACGGSGGGGGGGGDAPAAASLALLAGNTGGAGNVDGTGSAARFVFPAAVATDAAGNVYVADTDNHTVRKITPGGAVSTFAGSPGVTGSADGTGGEARFNVPRGIATDAAGNVYVTDSLNNTVRKITPDGAVTTLAGTAGTTGSADGTGPAANFNLPIGITVNGAGTIYVTDTDNQTLRQITPAGVVTTLAGTPGAGGNADGTGAAALFNFPLGVAVDGTGNIYIADNNTIRRSTAAGVVITIAGTGAPGSTDGTGPAASFNGPQGVAADVAGNVYVVDTLSHTVRKITPARVVTTLAGAASTLGSTDGTGTAARFRFPIGIATDSAGNIYVADTNNHTVRKITPAAAVSTLAGAAPFPGSADGTGAAAGFFLPVGITADNSGNIFVADLNNNTVRKMTTTGVASTLAGSAGLAGASDGTGPVARLFHPAGLVPDGTGGIYVADSGNHTIRGITAAGVVSTIAGTGAPGSADGTGTAAAFNDPEGIAIDSSGNLYIADRLNHTIRMMTPAGVVTTFAGAAGAPGSADGTGTAARFNSPVGMAADGAGNLYVTDNGNSTVRKITPAAAVTTLAGAALSSGFADGTGAAARFKNPRLLAVDDAGNLYVADTSNHAVRKITPAAEVTTVVGSPKQFGFLPGPLPGTIAFPAAVMVSGTSLYITLPNGVAVVQNRP